jgi:hypothetical protein
MVWYKPWTWFSRNAQVVLANANTSVLKNALRNYIKAVNSLKPNMRTNQAITNLLNQANANANNKRVIRNRLANGIAKVVAASRPALVQAAVAVANGAPEGAAAAAVNNATAAIKNLNNRMAELNTLLPPGASATPNNKARLYMAKKYNNSANRTINKNGKYAPIWVALNVLKAANTAAVMEEFPGANIELTRNAILPNNNSRKAKLVRNSGNSNWRFVNAANAEKYNINRKNKNDPVVVLKGQGAAVNKSKAAAELVYKQAYGGRGGVGLIFGQWNLNKSIKNLSNTPNKMARFIGLNRAIVNANLNSRSNRDQIIRAKRVLNGIIQKQKAVPGN